jgi:succinate dehydrogenase hydrophobic anchor subunit
VILLAPFQSLNTTMILSAATRAPLLARRALASSKKQFSSGNPLAADSGAFSTHNYHRITLSLSLVAPAYFLLPSSMSDGFVDKALGVLLGGHIAAHQWIGMNYVATDYVPKISKKLLGPARIVNAGLAAVILLGVGRIAVSSEGGLKGCLKVSDFTFESSFVQSSMVQFRRSQRFSSCLFLGFVESTGTGRKEGISLFSSLDGMWWRNLN